MQVLLAYAASVEGERVAARFPEALEMGVGKAAAAAMVALALGTRSRESAKPGSVLLFGVCGAYPLRHVQDRLHGDGTAHEGRWLQSAL